MGNSLAASSGEHPYRTHTCGSIAVGERVKLSGWVDRKRDHGSLLFIDLRDHAGVLQLVFNAGEGRLTEIADSVPVESFIIVRGIVTERLSENINPNVANGHLEVVVETWDIESRSLALPFPIHGDEPISDELRLKFRFLDLRRERVKKNILFRAEAVRYLRDKMHSLGFNEFTTPILTSASPEGARDYLVPSRNFPGRFYALPQAPQQFKQLLMASGFDRYFQIAPCFRDEDSRANRSPGDFYQLDVEMGCATQEDVFALMEEVVGGLFAKYTKFVCSGPFPRITYADSMLRYGNDKPDLRNPLVISEVSKMVKGCDFKVFADGLAQGKVVRAIGLEARDLARPFFDRAIEFAKSVGSAGLAYVHFDSQGEARGPIVKFLGSQLASELRSFVGINGEGAIFFLCDYEKKLLPIASQVRDYLARTLDLLKGTFEFCWIVDFPYFEYDEARKQLDFAHNPFSMPRTTVAELATADRQTLESIRACQYDLVCNGVELASGAIRNHRIELLKAALAVVGYNEDDMYKSFGGLLRAFDYGIPPHGGIAPGLERMLMLILGEESIKEVICFPLSQRGEDILMGAPSTVSDKHLHELGLQMRAKSE